MDKMKNYWEELKSGNIILIGYTVGAVAVLAFVIFAGIYTYNNTAPTVALADSSIKYNGTIKGKTRSGSTVRLTDEDGTVIDEVTTKSGKFKFTPNDGEEHGYTGDSGKYLVYAIKNDQSGDREKVKVEDEESDDDDYYTDTDYDEDEDSTEEEEEKDDSEYDSVSYDELARNPEDYENESVTLSGQVMQVQNSDDGCIVLLWQNDDSDQLVMVYIDDADFPENGKILEDDEITIYGYASGTKEYDTVSGASNEVPLIYVDKTVVDSGKSSNAF